MSTALPLEDLYDYFFATLNSGINSLGAPGKGNIHRRGPADSNRYACSCRYCGGDLLTILNSGINLIAHAAVPAVPGVLVTSYRISKRPLSTVYIFDSAVTA